MTPSAHLLRTMAAVPPSVQVLDAGCGTGRHTIPLAQLGFDVHGCDPSPEAVEACRAALAEAGIAERIQQQISTSPLAPLPYPDDHFGWVVAYRAFGGIHSLDHLHDVLVEMRRVLAPGGWIYLAVPTLPDDFNPAAEANRFASDSGPRLTFTPDSLRDVMTTAGFAEAAPMRSTDDGGNAVLETIFRRVEAGIIG